jgi:lambda repressor-like predicted transcriptional regulator
MSMGHRRPKLEEERHDHQVQDQLEGARYLVPIFEKEGWSHAQVASDWGISLATLEGHLDQQEGLMAPPRRYIDWQRFDELKAQGLPLLRISAEMGIPEATLRQSAQRRDKTHQSTPEAHHNTPKAHPRTPEEPELNGIKLSSKLSQNRGVVEL